MRARGQTRYQVRFGWGAAGAAEIAPDAHVLVWVDVLPTDPGAVPVALLPDGPEVLLAGLGDATAVADRVLRLQAEIGDRCVVAIVAAGIHDTPAPPAPAASDSAGPATPAYPVDARPDFAVEDLLAAGTVVDALAARGVDHTSPEAAAACAAATGLHRAVRHLVTASVSAALLDASGRHDLVEAALLPSGPLRVLRPVAGGDGRVPREHTPRA